jgi:hypothetical protein
MLKKACSRLLVTDAIDADARAFYERFGLVALTDRFPAQMVLDLRGLVLGGED